MIDPNFLGEDWDLEAMVAGFKTTRRLMETPALRALQKKDIFTSDVRTDDDIRAILRNRVDTVYHPVGTCKMGTDAMAVVDPKLKVHGVQGLRVVDASIMCWKPASRPRSGPASSCCTASPSLPSPGAR